MEVVLILIAALSPGHWTGTKQTVSDSQQEKEMGGT